MNYADSELIPINHTMQQKLIEQTGCPGDKSKKCNVGGTASFYFVNTLVGANSCRQQCSSGGICEQCVATISS